MKKLLFIVTLLILCLSLTAVAYAEYRYTQEIIRDEFHVFIPSSFKLYSREGYQYTPDTDSLFPSITINECMDNCEYIPISYTNAGECVDALLATLVVDEDYKIVRVDECAGLLVTRWSESTTSLQRAFRASIYTTNRRRFLQIDVSAYSSEEALDLVTGILDHIVAPEMPHDETLYTPFREKPTPEYVDAFTFSPQDYTQAVSFDTFTVYLPSCFALDKNSDAPLYYFSDAFERVEIDFSYETYDENRYSSSFIRDLELSSKFGYGFYSVPADECVAVLIQETDQSFDQMTVYIESSRATLTLYIRTNAINGSRIVSELANGILVHIDAPEIPLEP